MNNFDEAFNNYVSEINLALDALFADETGEVSNAMKYSLSNGGKRVRPMLTMEFCRLCGEKPDMAIHFACAVEMIHTYSLIHDDLPCMDDDDMRRGKPSCHKKFGETTALLAGDALQAAAFAEIAADKSMSAEQRVKALEVLARASGVSGMVGGQELDLQNDGREVSLSELTQIDNKKTGALITAACELGCVAAGANEAQARAARDFALPLGLAFQITDDILDVTSSTQTLGKPVGSDAERKMSTYVTVLGVDGARKQAQSLTDEAIAALDVFSSEADFLRRFAQKLALRKS